MENGEKRQLTQPPEHAIYGDAAPVFSPDGRTVAFERQMAWNVSHIYSAPMTGGEPTQLTDMAGNPDALDWTSDGREIVFSRQRRLWRVSASGGSPQQLASIGENPVQPTVSRQAGRLTYVRREYATEIWRIDAQSSIKRPVKFISSTRHEGAPRFSPDGKRIVFTSNRSGSGEIWVCDSDGSNFLQVTAIGGAGTPRWSPDSRNIVFD